MAVRPCPESRKSQVIAMLADGMSIVQIAKELGVGERQARRWVAGLRASGDIPPSGVKQPPSATSATFQEDGANYAQASATGTEVKTLEELKSSAQVDESIWEVYDWGIKTWAVGAKGKEGFLEFEDGKIVDGHLLYTGLQKLPLRSVWAKFIRRDPIRLYPTIQPVHCDVSFSVPPPPVPGLKRALIWADPQFGFSRDYQTGHLEPFHDRFVLDLILQFAQYLQPDRVSILGDIMDLVMWTDRFLRSPKYEYTTQPANCVAHWWLRQLREILPLAHIEAHPGNHDKRMQDSIKKHLRPAYGLKPADEMHRPPAMSPERLLALDALGIVWCDHYPNDYEWLNPDLVMNHGNTARGKIGSTAAAIVAASDTSSLNAHIHRRESASRTIHTRDGRKDITAHCIRAACRTEGVVPPANLRENWQQGFAIVDYDETHHQFYDVAIRNREAIWNGMTFTARDRLDDVRKDFPNYQF